MGRRKHESGCPLCDTPFELLQQLKTNSGRLFYKCPVCLLLHCDRRELPDVEQEKMRYYEHINEYNNLAYVEFLERIFNPTLPYLQKNDVGLDFGCGPVPVLAALIRKKGFECDHYDPIFFPDVPGFPEKTYDFIFSTEVIEHFHHPKPAFMELIGMLKVGGILALMTECWTDLSRFPNWYYVRDETHVSIYHEKTLDFIVEKLGMEIVDRPEKRVFIMRKSEFTIDKTSY